MNIPNEKCYRALMLDGEEEYTDYIAALGDKIALNRKDYVSLNNRGVAYYELGELGDAQNDLSSACKLKPKESAPFLNLADVLRKLGEFDAALEAAGNAIRLAPAEPSGYMVRAGIYEEMGDAVKAAADVEKGKKCKASKRA